MTIPINLAATISRACAGTGCTREEALRLTDDATPLDTLLDAADRVREFWFGRQVELCVIVNARSGACREDCRFCAQSAHAQTDAPVYPLGNAKTLLNAAATHTDGPAHRFGIVTSGPTVGNDECEIIADAIQRLPDATGLDPCASLGQLNDAAFARLYAAGLRRYHHNLETSETFFPQICTTHSWQARVETIRAAQRAGLEVCSGGLFGLGESWVDRIDLALTLRGLGIDSVPVNYLNPVPGTALADRPLLSAETGLRILALYRLLLPTAVIRVCGGRPSTLGDRQTEMIRAGANALMTGDYLTTAGITPATDREMLTRLGYTIVPRCQRRA